MKIYTKTGDDGETGLFGGPRVRKDDPRIEACGAVDELNAIIGLTRTQMLPQIVQERLTATQHELFAIGAELSTPDPIKHGTAMISEKHIAAIEQAIDFMEAELPPLTQFILPGGLEGAALLHMGRSICRRAERRVITLASVPGAAISQNVIVYFNRLSDYLFVAARFTNHEMSMADVPWHKPS